MAKFSKQLKRTGIVVALLCTCLAAGTAAEGELPISGPALIQDGDTFEIGPVVIRLNGSDAPEAGQKCADAAGKTWQCGTEATNRLAELIGGREVNCIGRSRDAYGRIISDCDVSGVNLAQQMVSEGMAWAAVRFTQVYASDQEAAHDAGLGIWSGNNQTAWEYRADKWGRAVAASPDGCPIKGNISMTDGERIYHTPWSRWYDKTKINTAKGERWFCDEEEAVLAGWRAARSQ